MNYEVSGCVLITAESGAVPVYQSLAGIVFCFRIITSRADTPRRFVLGKSSSHMTIPLRRGSSRRVFVSGVFVSLCAEPRRGQLVLVIRRVRELPIRSAHRRREQRRHRPGSRFVRGCDGGRVVYCCIRGGPLGSGIAPLPAPSVFCV